MFAKKRKQMRGRESRSKIWICKGKGAQIFKLVKPATPAEVVSVNLLKCWAYCHIEIFTFKTRTEKTSVLLKY